MYDQQQGNPMRACGVLGAGIVSGQAAPKSDTQLAVDRLSSSITQLGDRIGLLHSRLSPVLTMESPPSINPQTLQGTSPVPLAAELNRLAAQVEEIRNGTVEDALDRLHV